MDLECLVYLMVLRVSTIQISHHHVQQKHVIILNKTDIQYYSIWLCLSDNKLKHFVDKPAAAGCQLILSLQTSAASLMFC